MAPLRDELGERTVMPTPLRLAEARRRGQVARSADLVSTGLLLGAVAAAAMSGPALLGALREMTKTLLGSASAEVKPLSLVETLYPVLWAAGPIVLIPLGAAVLANLVQVGALVSGEPLKPDLRRISPVVGLRRMFSSRSLVRAGMSSGKILAVAAVCLVTIRAGLPEILAKVTRGSATLLENMCDMGCHLAIRIVVVLGFLGLIDWIYQRWEHRRDLMITPREFRDDLRRMEGDPRVARKQKDKGRELASQRLASEVPRADAVITASGPGPTVALRYDSASSAPRVVGCGRDLLAAHIRRLAAAYGVILVEDSELAGLIYRLCKVGDTIPERLYERVAEILAFCNGAGPKQQRTTDG